jgi:hypothetical protein
MSDWMRQHPVKVGHPAGCIHEGHHMKTAPLNGESVKLGRRTRLAETWNRSFQSIATSEALLRRLPLLRIYLVRGGFGKDGQDGHWTGPTNSACHKVHCR